MNFQLRSRMVFFIVLSLFLGSFLAIGFFHRNPYQEKEWEGEGDLLAQENQERESELIKEIRGMEEESRELVQEVEKNAKKGLKISERKREKSHTFEVHVHLINPRGLPVTRGEIIFAQLAQSWPAKKKRVTIREVPDKKGMASFSLSKKNWHMFQAYPIIVRTPGKQIVFQAQVMLEPFMELQIPEQVLLKGKISLPQGLIKKRTLSFYFLDSDSSTYGGDFLGKTSTNEKGEFYLEASPPKKTGFVRVALSLGRNMVSIRTPLQILCSKNGASLNFDLHPFRLKVIHKKSGKGLPGVQIHIREDSGSKDSLFQHILGKTDSLGRADFLLPRKKMIAIFKKDGFFIKTEKINAKKSIPLAQPIPMEKIIHPLVVHGFVVGPKGKVVENAVISCFPHKVPMSALAEFGTVTRSNQYGDFRLQIPFHFPITLGAYHKTFGFSKRKVFSERRGEIRIRLGNTGTLSLSIHGTVAGHPLSSHSRIRWLIKRRGERWSRNGSRNGFFPMGSLQIENLPVGKYLLYVVESQGLFLGGTEVSIIQPGITHASIKVIPGSFFQGKLVSPPIQEHHPPLLHLIHPIWAKKELLKELYFASWRGNRFRLFAGNLRNAMAEIRIFGRPKNQRVFLRLDQRNILRF